MSNGLPACLIVSVLGLAATPGSVGAQPRQTDEGFYVTAVYGVNRDLFSLAAPFAQGLALGGFRDVRIDFEPTDRSVVGISAAGHVSRYVVAFSEFLYSDLGTSRVSGRIGFSPRAVITMHPRLFEWTSGVRAQVPAGVWRVRPYFGGGAGFVRIDVDAEGAGTSISEHGNDFVYHFDLGAQVFLTRFFGVGPEFRFVHVPDGTFKRFFVGAIFRFQ